MTFVVGEDCIKCKHTDCVEVCPVDCFYEGPNFLVIHPDECIDCALCEPECPIDAIFSEDELPADQENFLDSTRNWPRSGPTSQKRKTRQLTPLIGKESPANLHSRALVVRPAIPLPRAHHATRRVEPSQCVDLYLPHPLSGEANLLPTASKVEAS